MYFFIISMSAILGISTKNRGFTFWCRISFWKISTISEIVLFSRTFSISSTFETGGGPRLRGRRQVCADRQVCDRCICWKVRSDDRGFLQERNWSRWCPVCFGNIGHRGDGTVCVYARSLYQEWTGGDDMCFIVQMCIEPWRHHLRLFAGWHGCQLADSIRANLVARFASHPDWFSCQPGRNQATRFVTS